MNKLISVIVPVYNVEKYLEKCIQSILNQEYTELEIILVDDGSKDNSGKICDDYAKKDNRIKVIHKENGGLSDARNAGLKIALGEYIGFVDSDDYIDTDMYLTLYQLIENNNADISIVSFREFMNGKMIDVKESKSLEIMSKIEGIKELLLDNKIQSYAWNKLFKKELFKDIEFPTGKNFEDIATTLLLFEKTEKIVRMEEPKYNYLRRSDSIIGIKNYKTYSDYIDVIMDKYKYLKGKYEEINKYNDYNFVISMIWVYTIILKYEIKELEPKFDEIMPLIKKMVENDKDLFDKELDYYNKAILNMMLLDKSITRKAVIELYTECRKKREEGEFLLQI